MPDIMHDFPIRAPAHRVFQAVSTPEGLDRWWTETSAGDPVLGTTYALGFGPGYDWRARVSRCVRDREFELTMTRSDPDWAETRVGFRLAERDGITQVDFHHRGWPEANDHYRTSCYCWAMYLRLLKRFLEVGETVPYPDRLDA